MAPDGKSVKVNCPAALEVAFFWLLTISIDASAIGLFCASTMTPVTSFASTVIGANKRVVESNLTTREDINTISLNQYLRKCYIIT